MCYTIFKYEYTLIFTLLGDLEVFLAAQDYCLQHLMGRHVSLEVSWIPKLTHELAEPLHQQEHDVTGRPADSPVVLLFQEIVPQRRDIGEGLRKRLQVVHFQCYGHVYKDVAVISTCSTTLA